MEKEFFDAIEVNAMEHLEMPNAAAPGKLWGVVNGLWKMGFSPINIVNAVMWIMSIISQFNTLTIEELVQKIADLFRASVPTSA